MTKKKECSILKLFCVLFMFVLFFTQAAQAGETSGKAVAAKVPLKVDSLLVGVSSSGFHPSAGNYLPIQVSVSRNANAGQLLKGDVYCYIQILDKKGSYVYQQKYTANYGGYVRYCWNGKSKVGTGSYQYVKDGTYQVRVLLKSKGLTSVSKTKTFKVSRKALAGSSGLAKVSEVPMLTGDSEIDYMAELMIREAGVKAGMSADEKVKKIYHYITTHFLHTHDYYDSKYKVHYRLTNTATINKYRKVWDAKYKKGTLIYTYHPLSVYAKRSMQVRRGVCTNHAAVFTILCNHVGIDAGNCQGYYLNLNGTKAGHSWNYAVINGKKYYFDVDVELQNLGKGQGDYYWYKKTYAEAKKNHEFH